MNFNDISSFAIGIRYKKSFSVLDKWGSIVDYILNKTQFDTDYFSNYNANNNNEKLLYNPNTNNTLRLNFSDIIFEHNFCETDIAAEFNNISSSYLKLANNLFKEYKFNDFIRVGIIFKSNIISDESVNTVITKSINKNKYSDIPSYFRISLKIPEKDSLKKKSINNYYNKIITATNNETNNSLIYDFQKYFNPQIELFNQFNYKPFIDKAKLSIKEDIFSLFSEEN